MQRNAKASIAVLLLAIAALAITISFLFMKSASPLGTYIGVTILCEQTDDPIVGLPVTVSYPDGTVVATIPTDSEGFAGWFGSGVPDGPYVITYTWGQTITHEVTINCSLIYWQFTYEVCNPQIIKHFYYEIYGGAETPPVVDMSVSLYQDGVLFDTQLTDATGTVSWYVNVCHDYYMEYTYGGVLYRVPEKDYIHFGVPPTNLVWEEWNALQPKSGGG